MNQLAVYLMLKWFDNITITSWHGILISIVLGLIYLSSDWIFHSIAEFTGLPLWVTVFSTIFILAIIFHKYINLYILGVTAGGLEDDK